MYTVIDFINLCTEDSLCDIILYDIDEAEEIYNGTLSEIPFNITDYEIQSFDPPYNNVITLNVSKQ